MTVDEDGPLCCCGNYGCLSALASCSAIMQSMTDAIRKGVHSRVQEMVEDDLDRINIEMIIQAAMENDSLAFRVLNDSAMHIGVALADVVNLLNPAVVVFGGPLFQTNPHFVLEPIQRVIKQRALEKAANEVQLMVSELGGNPEPWAPHGWQPKNRLKGFTIKVPKVSGCEVSRLSSGDDTG